jgi:hypothetical protein
VKILRVFATELYPCWQKIYMINIIFVFHFSTAIKKYSRREIALQVIKGLNNEGVKAMRGIEGWKG